MKLLLIIFVVTSCLLAGQTKHPSDYEILLQQSKDELSIKTQFAKDVWGLGTFDRWDLDQDIGDLVFSNKDGKKVIAPAQIIGTFYTGDNTWLWAWANESINDSLKKDSLKLKQYGEEHHIEKLTTRKWVGTMDDAWEMTALAVKLCGKEGAYRGPAGETSAFIIFGPVRMVKK